jgi:hypothetical protein
MCALQVLNWEGRISEAEWSIAQLYTVLVFEKCGSSQPQTEVSSNSSQRRKAQLSPEEPPMKRHALGMGSQPITKLPRSPTSPPTSDLRASIPSSPPAPHPPIPPRNPVTYRPSVPTGTFPPVSVHVNDPPQMCDLRPDSPPLPALPFQKHLAPRSPSAAPFRFALPSPTSSAHLAPTSPNGSARTVDPIVRVFRTPPGSPVRHEPHSPAHAPPCLLDTPTEPLAGALGQRDLPPRLMPKSPAHAPPSLEMSMQSLITVFGSHGYADHAPRPTHAPPPTSSSLGMAMEPIGDHGYAEHAPRRIPKSPTHAPPPTSSALGMAMEPIGDHGYADHAPRRIPKSPTHAPPPTSSALGMAMEPIGDHGYADHAPLRIPKSSTSSQLLMDPVNHIVHSPPGSPVRHEPRSPTHAPPSSETFGTLDRSHEYMRDNVQNNEIGSIAGGSFAGSPAAMLSSRGSY